MRRRTRILVLALPVLTGAGLAYLYDLATPSGGVDADSCDRIEPGMNEAQVCRILGGRAAGAVDPEEADALWLWPPPGTHVKQWLGRTCSVWVAFRGDRVASKRVLYNVDRRPLWTKALERLGLADAPAAYRAAPRLTFYPPP